MWHFALKNVENIYCYSFFITIQPSFKDFLAEIWAVDPIPPPPLPPLVPATVYGPVYIHEDGTKSNRDHFVSIIVLFIIDVYMRPGQK